MNAPENDEQRTGLSYRWVIFLILAMGYAIVYFHRVAPAVVVPELTRSFRIKGVALGVLASAYFYPYALMQLPSGLLSDSLGPRKTVTAFTLIAAAGAILFGISPTFFTAILGRIMVGLGVSVLFIPTLKILANWFEVEKFAIVTGILMAIGGLGWLFAATPLALLTLWLGWRVTFIIIGLVSLVLALLTYLIVRDHPAELGVSGILKAEGTTSSSSGEQKLPLLQGVKMVLSEKKFWPLAVWFFCTGGILFGFGGLWAGPYLMQVYNLSKAQTGNILMMIAVGMIVGSPMLGLLSEKVFHGRKLVLLISSSTLTGIWVLFVLLVDGLSVFFLYGLFFLLGIFASGIVVIGFAAAKELFPAQIAGTSTGMVNLFPFAGGALFQPVIGLVLDYSGKLDNIYSIEAYRISFVGFLLAAILALISVLFMRETPLVKTGEIS
ncbi:MFS transporter [Candidatus Aerophobetes bacterium Ae_b3b]|nr:MAG: MFS transporter [Candidatus Aerophobetes bacterium Ae_b3b]